MRSGAARKLFTHLTGHIRSTIRMGHLTRTKICHLADVLRFAYLLAFREGPKCRKLGERTG
jgi:hypothetical protein